MPTHDLASFSAAWNETIEAFLAGGPAVPDHLKERIKQAEAAGEDVFPVTQLWNSLLGLVVLPKERDGNRIPATPISDVWPDGRPLVQERKGESRTLRRLVRILRNAVAHAGVDLMPDENREIHQLKLWNLRDGERNWEAVVLVDDLEQLAKLIADSFVEAFAAAA